MGISSLWSENDRDITWILLGSRDDSYCAVLSVNVYARSEMMHTLQELNLDAARYRWLREKFVTARWEMEGCMISHPMLTGVSLDAMIDGEISCDEYLREVSSDE